MTPNVNFVPILTHPSHSIERREEKNCSKLLFRFYCDTKQLRKFMWEYILFGHACWYACHTHSLSRFFFSTTFLDCVMQVSVEYSSTSFLVQILFCHFFSMRFVVVVVLKCYVCFIIVTVCFSIRFTLDNSEISFFFVHVFNHIWHASNEIFKFAFKWVLNSFTLHHFESTNTHWKW